MKLSQEIIDEIMLYNGEFEQCIGISEHAALKLYNPKVHTWQWATENSKVKVLKWFYKQFDDNSINLFKCARLAGKLGCIKVVKWLYSINYDLSIAMTYALYNGQIEIAIFIYNKYNSSKKSYIKILEPYISYTDVLNIACRDGTLETIKFMYKTLKVSLSTNSPTYAAEGGKLDILQWLYKKFTKKSVEFNKIDISPILKHGHLDVIKWLYKKDLCIIECIPIEIAVESGNLELIKWLYKKGFKQYTYRAITKASKFNHYEIEEFLHTNLYLKNKRRC